MRINSFFFGCVVGLVPPAAAHLLISFTSLSVGNQPLSLYVIAALINLLLLRFFYRRSLEQSARGVIFITFVASLLLIYTEKLTLT